MSASKTKLIRALISHGATTNPGVIAGGQIGYNYQWNWLVLGIEGDLGYMNTDGSRGRTGLRQV